MANTYFRMTPSYKRGFDNVSQDVSLTAFVGGTKSIQITIGRSCLLLSNYEAEKLAAALMERVNGKISATGVEQSEFTDIED